MRDSSLLVWILTYVLFILLFFFVIYTLLRGCLLYAGRFCRCVKLNKWCCCFKIDWQAYRRERESLRRIRELRQRHRELLVRQEFSTFSQIPGAVPDSVLMHNNVGFVLVSTSPEVPRSIRSQLTENQRRKALEQIVNCVPYKVGHMKEKQGEKQETGISEKESKSMKQTTITNILPSAKSQTDAEETTLDPESQEQDLNRTSNNNSSYAVPAHEEPSSQNCCAICLDPFVDGELINETSECSHFFHKDCLLGWLDQHDICPCCRRVMVTERDWKQAMEDEGTFST